MKTWLPQLRAKQIESCLHGVSLGLFLMVTSLLMPGAATAQDSVSTLAGQPGVSGFTNGSGNIAAFADPASLVVDAFGNCFIADSANHVIRKLSASGQVTTFAGLPGTSGAADGNGSAARFDTPSGLALDAAGNLFVADTGNNTLRKITSGGVVSTLAGVAGKADYQDGAAASALFSGPLGLAVAKDGRVFICDCGNHCLRVLSNGVVSTLAGYPRHWGAQDGSGTNALFNSPCGIALDASGNAYVSDANNQCLRKVTPSGAVSLFAGSFGAAGWMDGPRLTARFHAPAELIFDANGNLLVADSQNQVLRKITTNGVVSTMTGSPGNYGHGDGANGAGRFYNPYSIALAPDGTLRVTDTYNELIRSVAVPFQLSLNASGTNGPATLSWDSLAGRNYQVQVRDPVSGVWSNFSPILNATGTKTTWTDTNHAILPVRLYRVSLLP